MMLYKNHLELSFIFPQNEHVHHSLSIVFPQAIHSQVAGTGRDGIWVVVLLPTRFLAAPLIGLDVRSITALVRLLVVVVVLLLLPPPPFLLLPLLLPATDFPAGSLPTLAGR